MRFVFRVDASLQIGTGHVMRCLTLADALRGKGAVCRFVCREHPGNLLETIQQRGFAVLLLPAATIAEGYASESTATAYAAWLGTDWQTDATQTLNILGDVSDDWLIVDHYALDARWERSMRDKCRRIMVIDDLADREHDCELLLDQNLGRQAADYLNRVPTTCKLLIGPKFALLRPEFAAMRDYSLVRRSNPEIRHILISIGGVDKDNVTGRILEALKLSALPANCRITVVMGMTAPWLEMVCCLSKDMPWPTEVLVGASDMAKLMADSDLAIGAAGSTSWERCCLGLPTLMLILADNQRAVARGLEHAGAAYVVQDVGEIMEAIPRLIHANLASPQQYIAMSRIAANIVDGQGAIHLINQLGC
ncbi:MAG: UDP-2,4-diacetamido-2,4,6-trideoxy-beta-L-altropyranose hydrolase [Betaproteobacteria bacterium]|nr:UDP-2,4-diacetamido-2,4,6-trideoxy-beta-L-altropyranose hydrolase [Betaproteobacteria bacterium]